MPLWKVQQYEFTEHVLGLRIGEDISSSIKQLFLLPTGLNTSKYNHCTRRAHCRMRSLCSWPLCNCWHVYLRGVSPKHVPALHKLVKLYPMPLGNGVAQGRVDMQPVDPGGVPELRYWLACLQCGVQVRVRPN